MPAIRRAAPRHRRLTAVLLALSLLALPCLILPATATAETAAATATPRPGRLFDAQTFTLDNGLQVVVVEDHRVPVVSQMVWYKVGAADEPGGKSGIAHLLEHLMFKGTDSVAPGDFSKIVARHGGQDNAFTSSDYTAYYQNIAAEHLDLVMKMEADRMRHLRLAEDDVLTERDVVIEERLTRTENEPAALLDERLDLALWVNHPYRNPVIGWQNELADLGRQDALDFYKQWYAPNNAVVVISGDVTLDRVRRLAETYYGPLDRGPDIRRARPTQRPPEASVRIVMKHPRVAQPRWKREFIAPSLSTVGDDHSRVYALQVLSELLGGGATSRLYRSLVIDHKLAAGAGSWYSPRAVDWGTFGVWFTPRPGVPTDKVEAVLQAELDKLLAEGVGEQEVADAKLRMRAGVVYARDSLQGAAQTIGAALATGGTLDEVETWPQHIGAVTRDQVMAAARAVLRDSAAATGILLPAAAPAAADRS
jgi:zinc protease